MNPDESKPEVKATGPKPETRHTQSARAQSNRTNHTNRLPRLRLGQNLSKPKLNLKPTYN
jgi:hypothetical protein